jgi:ribosomal protein L25 (general stress protein Ctc)
MLAKMETNQERREAKTDADLKEMKEEMKSQIGVLVSQMDAHQAKMEVNHEEWMAAMKASQERMEALMDISLETTEVCLEMTEVNRGKVETKMEVGLEEGAVETIRALKDQSGDWGSGRSWPPPADG